MKRFTGKLFNIIVCVLIVSILPFQLAGCAVSDNDTIVLRVSSWEEYIDEGEWDEAIELANGVSICPESGIIDDFEEWFYETYGKKVRVEYSTFGTNEELYNQILMGDEYDLVCPSEYMIMKLLAEDRLIAYSDSFYDESIESNYYTKGVSPYIKNIFDNLSIGDNYLGSYAAGYMWGTLGIVYNPDVVSQEEAAHWDLFLNEKYSKRITIKDSIRDAYFAGSSIYNMNLISSVDFLKDKAYKEKLSAVLNSTDADLVNSVEDILSKIKNNVYSLETDSGKADMVSGKVVANQQWSGDAVYTLDQAEEDGCYLCYSVPEESTNLWFDGWCMLKSGIKDNSDRQLAAEAFVNFVSRPDNAVRNMEYIGYTSVISGGSDSTILDYIKWNYSVDEQTAAEENIELADYNTGYFFTGLSDEELDEEQAEKYTVTTSKDQTKRQLFAQYPTQDVMARSVVMEYFDKEENEIINQMWLNVRCFDLYNLFKR